MAVGQVEIANLLVRLTGDLGEFQEMLSNAEGITGKFSEKVGKKLKKIGKTATVGVTLPIVGAAGAALKFSEDLNKAMANVQSLGVDDTNLAKFRDDVQSIAVETGKSTGDIAGGLYQVVSAGFDMADASGVLAINARAATAGLATTEQAIALTSAVTKGYGDTTEVAVQKAADLAFMTVKLGQTDFPQLAAAIGKVTPMAAALGVTQEELFATFATLTGVTGNAAEVTTQAKAAFQAMLKPTAEMGEALGQVTNKLKEQGKLVETKFSKQWFEVQERIKKARMELAEATKQNDTKKMKELGLALKDLSKFSEEVGKSLGQTVFNSTGLKDSLALLGAEAEGDTNILGKMFGSSEALTAVLALTGSQAETFAQKLEAMKDPTNAVTDAFEAQTEGVSNASFAMAQLRTKMQVAAENIGEKLVPILSRLTDVLTGLVDWFSDLSDETQDYLLIAAGAAAAFGPLALGLGTMVSVIPTLIGAFRTLTTVTWLWKASLAGAAIAGIGILSIAIYKLNPAIRDLNDELARSKNLTDELNKKTQKRGDDVMSTAAGLSGEDKRKFLQFQLDKSNKNISGKQGQLSENKRLKSVEEAIAVSRITKHSGLLGALSAATGITGNNQLVANRQRDIDVTKSQLKAAQEQRDRIRDELNRGKSKNALLAEAGIDPNSAQNADNLEESASLLGRLVDATEGVPVQGAVN